MTPEQQRLMVKAARNLITERKNGRKVDPHALKWAKTIVRNFKNKEAA